MTTEPKQETTQPSQAGPTPSAPIPVQSGTPTPSGPAPSAAPAVSQAQPQITKVEKEAKPKEDKEERVKKARALLDQQVDFISKREKIPKDIVRMELYLEARMRKTILPKIDRLYSLQESTDKRVASLGDLILRIPSIHAPGDLAESDTVEAEEIPLQPATAIEPPPDPESLVDPNDSFFGSVLIYLVSGEAAS